MTDGRSAKTSLRLRRDDFPNLAKFATVGALNFIASFVAYIVLFDMLSKLITVSGEAVSFVAALSNGLAYCAGGVNSFLLNKHWTFRPNSKNAVQLRRFVILNAAVLLATSLLIHVLMGLPGMDYRVAWISVTVLAASFNYLFSRDWVFARSG